MRVILQATDGPGAGASIEVLAGQRLICGRSPGADLSVPSDGLMSTNHFAIECTTTEGRLVDLGSTNGTKHNHDFVIETQLNDGDSISAGQTTFAVSVEGATTAPPAAAKFDASAAGGDDTIPATIVCDGMQLTEEGQALLAPEISAREFIDILLQQDLFADAIRLQARILPAPAAVLWASECVAAEFGEELSEADRAALHAARTWAAQPTEQNRRAAETAADATSVAGPASMVALAAFWSGDNIALPGKPPIEPDKQLTAQGITGALMLVAVREPEAAADKYRSFLERAQTAPTSAN